MRGKTTRWVPTFFLAVETEARKDQLALLVREFPI